MIRLIDENAHPLVTRPVRVHRSARLARTFDFDPEFAGGYRVMRIFSLHHEIRMTVEMLVLCE
jgi:hypothetical protein